MTQVQTTWNLRQLMASQQMFKTTELIPLLAEYGVFLSREQVFRLVTQKPERASMQVIGAVCAALGCTPSELITVRVVEEQAVGAEPTSRPIGDLRPPRARIHRPPTSTAE